MLLLPWQPTKTATSVWVVWDHQSGFDYAACAVAQSRSTLKANFFHKRSLTEKIQLFVACRLWGDHRSLWSLCCSMFRVKCNSSNVTFSQISSIWDKVSRKKNTDISEVINDDNQHCNKICVKQQWTYPLSTNWKITRCPIVGNP